MYPRNSSSLSEILLRLGYLCSYILYILLVFHPKMNELMDFEVSNFFKKSILEE